MERHEHLFYCKQCKNQDFDVRQGLICKLTRTLADFDPVCPNFKSVSGEYGSTEFDAVKKKVDQVNNKTAKAGIRFANHILDSLVLTFAMFFIAIILESAGFIRNFSESDFYILYFFLAIVYYTIFETLTGKTPAKYMTKTKVVTEDGFQPTFQNILGRTMCRFIPFDSFSFLGTGIGWHDSISKTLVISEDGPKSDPLNF